MRDRPLTQARLKELVVYNDDGSFTWLVDTTPRPLKGKKAGFRLTNGYFKMCLDHVWYARSHIVWLYHHGVWPKDQIDHINCEKGDDRIENLREATQSQNSANKRVFHRKNALGVRGVVKKHNRYRATVYRDGRAVFSGQFDKLEDAMRAYDAAAIQHHGEFARLNFPAEHGR